ncbi:MAG: phage shock protein E [Phenylobacterium sp.]|jgi:phage shock protein E
MTYPKNLIAKLSTAVLSVLLMLSINANAKNISQEALQKLLKSDHKPLVVDVRTEGEYAKGHIPGAINIPHKKLKKRLAELKDVKNKQVILYCHSGTRANIAKKILSKSGFSQLDHLSGDFKAWSKKGLPLEKADKKDFNLDKRKVANPCGY